MAKRENIIICDESALHFHLHYDFASRASADRAGAARTGAERTGIVRAQANPLGHCARSAEALSAFNTTHPVYGGEPVDVLVPDSASRRANACITAHRCNYELPKGAFIELREGLYVTSPELTFARLGYGRSEVQLAQAAIDLCGRYYIDPLRGELRDRGAFLTTPKRLREFLESVPQMRGSAKAIRALKWVLANSGSPMETIMYLQYARPMRAGGFALPFDALNYDVSAKRFARIAEQGDYCIDMVNTERKIGVEYDGLLYHSDASADKRRRNALAALGWQVFPVDKHVLFDPEATEKSAYQIARKLGVRIQKPAHWKERYLELRRDLGLRV